MGVDTNLCVLLMGFGHFFWGLKFVTTI
jgi:hypothetical protein